MNKVAQSLIIIPTYNEIENINRMIQTIFELYPEISILIVDDGSPDGTAKVVQDNKIKFKNLNLMERQGKSGLGTAYIAGFKWALERGYEYILEMDCDFSHSPEDVIHLIDAMDSCDLAIGSRYINGIRIINWPMHRLLLSYGASIYTRVITGLKIKDVTGGFKCFSAKVLRSIDLNKIMSNGYSFQIELNFKAWSKQFRLREVPIVFTERRDGQSKMNGSIVREAIFAVIKMRLKKIFGTL